ncbi:MAG: 6-pyruvoyl-tetrahydropterin synthase-related protein [Patescibacteria group bacterium]
MLQKQYFPILALICLLCVTFIVHIRVLDVFFLSDDFGYILLAREVSPVESLKLFFTENDLGSGKGLFRPLVDIAFSVAYQFFGFTAKGYHAISLILHTLIAWLGYLLILRISKNHAFGFFSALLFIIYPMNLETIAWLSNWTTLVSSLFIMLSLFLYWEYQRKRNKLYFAASLLSVLISLLAKETAIIIPIAFILLDLAKHQVNKKYTKHIFKYWPNYVWSAIVVVGFFIWRFLMLMGKGGYRTEAGESIYKNISWNEIFSYWMTIKLFFLNFLNDQVFAFQNRIEIIYWGVGILLCILFILYIFNKNKTIPAAWIGFGFIWIYLFALPAFNLINNIHPDLSSSRFLYLSSFGFCIVLTVLLLDCVHNQNKKLNYAKGIIIGLFILSFSFFAYKNQVPWLEASAQVQFIGNQVQEQVDDPLENSKFYFKKLPDNWFGAYSLRNGIENYLLLMYDKPPGYLEAKKADRYTDKKKAKVNAATFNENIYMFKYNEEKNILKKLYSL